MLDPLPAPVEDWARARVTDVFSRELQYSLRVGPSKPLGSLGFSPGNRAMLSALPDLVRAYVHPGYQVICFQPAGLNARILRRHVNADDATWFYCWHKRSLRAVLDRHARVFVAAGWPTSNLEAFVQYVRLNVAPPCTPLFDAVADCFGDKLNPGRTDVLPGVSRQDLADAVRLCAGHGDPDEHHLWPALEAERLARAVQSPFPSSFVC